MAKGSGAGAFGEGMKIVKCVFIGANIIFLLAGGGLFGAAIFLLTELLEIEDAFDDQLIVVGLPTGAMLLGLAVLIQSAVGSIGALKENTCLLKIFLAMLAVTMFVELSIGGVLVAFNAGNVIKTKLDEYMEGPITGCSDLPRSLDRSCAWLPVIQTSLKCCGYEPDTITVGEGWKGECQDTGDIDAQRAASTNAEQYCNKAILDAMADTMIVVTSVLGVVFFVGVTFFIAAYFLICAINDDTKYY